MPLIEGNNTIQGTLGAYRMAGVPVNGVSGSFVGALPGATLIDTTNAKEYINVGTSLSPTWVVKGTQT